jgi:glycosyltransferase involved in cell wall biosynthesis
MGRESTLIPNCVSVKPRIIEETRFGILWVSTIRNWKRPWLFLALAKMLPQFHFVMVGGPDRNEQSVYEEIEKTASGIKNLTFVGFVPYEQIDSHFAKAKLFVNTSGSEGFPNSFLQAWLHEVPTISFVDCGAQVEGQPIGQVVDSIEDMADVVKRLMTDDDGRSTLGKRSRKYVEASHGIDSVLDLYEKAFRELLDTA